MKKIILFIILFISCFSFVFAEEKRVETRFDSFDYISNGYTDYYILKHGFNNYTYLYKGKKVFTYEELLKKYYYKNSDGIGNNYLIVRKNNDYYFIINDDIIGTYDFIDKNSIKFTNNKDSYFFEANVDEYKLLIRNGEEIGRYVNKTGASLRLSEDFKQYAFIKKEEDKKVLIINGEEKLRYEKIISYKFTKDFKNYYCVVKEGEKSIILKNGEEIGKYDGIRKYGITEDGESYYFIAKDDDNKKEIFILNGVEIGRYDSIDKSSFKILSNFTKYSFIAKNNGKEIVINTGIIEENIDSTIKETNVEDEKIETNLVKNPFLITKDGDKYILKKNGIEIWRGIGDSIGYIKEYSDDFEYIYFILETGEQEILMRNNNELGILNNISYFRISEDGKNYYYKGYDDNGIVLVRDGEEMYRYEEEYYISMYNYNWKYYRMLAFMSNGKIFLEKNIDDFGGYKTVGEYDGIRVSSFYFSEDTDDYYGIVEKLGKESLLINGLENGYYDDISSYEVSEDFKEYIYMARDGDEYFIVKNGEENKIYGTPIYGTYISDDLLNYYTISENFGKYFLSKNGEVTGVYDYIYDKSFKLGKDGNEYSFLAINNYKNYYITNIELDEKQKIYSRVDEKFNYDIKEDYIYQINLALIEEILTSIRDKKNIEKIDVIIDDLSDYQLKQVYKRLDDINFNDDEILDYKYMLMYFKNKIGFEFYKRQIYN